MFVSAEHQKGFTYIELIIVTSITVIIFSAIIVSFQYALQLGYITQAKLSALSLANDRMEYFRSLPYDDVGVVAGFPAGTIPQTSTFSLNGFTINERVRVDYVDAAADGSGGSDTNAITTDYKQIKVEYTWDLNGVTDDLALTTNIVPRSIETNVGGGTIRINVLDADSTLLENASVQIVGSSSTFPYDVTNPTDATGAALFSVPADSGYQAFVTANISGNQYSTSSTYVATTSNPIPSVAPFSVVESGISTLTFQIGELSDLEIFARSSVTEGDVEEFFTDTSGIATSTDVAVQAGQLELANTLGVYETNGVAFLDSIEPLSLLSWESVRVVSDVPANTNFKIQFYTAVPGGYTLIPDTDLPSNSTGFTDTLIDMTSLDPVLYPTTTIGISLETTDTSVTPAIRELQVFWRASETALSGESLTVRGDKVIGTQLDLTPIYKTTETIVTDGSGVATLADLEFDTYTVTPASARSLATACPAHPFIHQAGVDGQLELIYSSASATTVRIAVTDALGRALPGVSVRLDRGSYDVTQDTNTCGQTFFSGGGLTDATDFELTISSPGYTTQTIDPFEVNGETTLTVTLTP